MDLVGLGAIPEGEVLRLTIVMVPGKQITIAHIISNPDKILYDKLALNPGLDYQEDSAIGIISIMPAEAAVIAGDISIKMAKIQPAIIDRFRGTLIFSGHVADVRTAINTVRSHLGKDLDFWVPSVTVS